MEKKPTSPCNKKSLNGTDITDWGVVSTPDGNAIKVKDDDGCAYLMDLKELNPLLGDLDFNVIQSGQNQKLKLKDIEDVDIEYT